MVVKSLREVAKHFGKTPRTARNWARAGMPKLSGGAGYDLAQVEVWLKSARYLGASFRQMEADERVNTLFESAVLHLRRGLEQLCQSFVSARGKNRDALIDRAIHNILTDTMRQKLLLEERGGGGQ